MATPGVTLVDSNGNSFTFAGGFPVVPVGTPANPIAYVFPGDGNGGSYSYTGVTYALAFNGTSWDRIRKDSYANGPLWTTTGGSAYATVASAATANAVKTGAGRLIRAIVTATGTGVATFYDGLTATGNVIGAIAASAGLGAYTFDIPFTTGLTVVSATSGPALTFTYY